jgi:hypothetical protein
MIGISSRYIINPKTLNMFTIKKRKKKKKKEKKIKTIDDY